jgi:hypothetical protein
VLLVAVVARLALHPREVAAGVEHHLEVPPGRPEADRDYVVGRAERHAPARRQGHALGGAGQVGPGRRWAGGQAVDRVDPVLVPVQDLRMGRLAAPSLQRRAWAVPVHHAESRRV